MARGKRWTQEENKLLAEMVGQNMTIEDIFESGKFPGRTHDAIRMQIERLSFVQQKKKSIVEQISLSEGIISLEEVLKCFSTAFKQICETQELDRLQLERYKIVFGAAKDYGPLLAHYERMSIVEREIENLKKMVEEIRSQVSARNP